jgi:hypothetical protein
LETAYLERTWYDGNVYVGWNRNVPPSNPGLHHIKINIDAKERLFSLSSITSPAFHQLEDLADRQLAPYGEPRFESKYSSPHPGRRIRRIRSATPTRCDGPGPSARSADDDSPQLFYGLGGAGCGRVIKLIGTSYINDLFN